MYLIVLLQPMGKVRRKLKANSCVIGAESLPHSWSHSGSSVFWGHPTSHLWLGRILTPRTPCLYVTHPVSSGKVCSAELPSRAQARLAAVGRCPEPAQQWGCARGSRQVRPTGSAASSPERSGLATSRLLCNLPCKTSEKRCFRCFITVLHI